MTLKVALAYLTALALTIQPASTYTPLSEYGAVCLYHPRKRSGTTSYFEIVLQLPGAEWADLCNESEDTGLQSWLEVACETETTKAVFLGAPFMRRDRKACVAEFMMAVRSDEAVEVLDDSCVRKALFCVGADRSRPAECVSPSFLVARVCVYALSG